jgi:hypothetical protein
MSVLYILQCQAPPNLSSNGENVDIGIVRLHLGQSSKVRAGAEGIKLFHGVFRLDRVSYNSSDNILLMGRLFFHPTLGLAPVLA